MIIKFGGGGECVRKEKFLHDSVNSIYVTIETLSIDHDRENEEHVQYAFGR